MGVPGLPPDSVPGLAAAPGKALAPHLKRRLYVASVLADCALFLFVFILTRAFAEGRATAVQSGILGICNSLTYAGSCALFGHFSDRLGRRGVVAVGCVLVMAACVMATQVVRIPLYYVLMALAGLGMGMFYPPLISDLTAGNGRGRSHSKVLLRFCIAWNLGVVAGQLAGGALFGIDPSLGLWLGAILMAINLVIALATLSGRPPPATADSAPSHTATRGGRVFACMGWLSNVGTAFSVSVLIYILPHLLVRMDIAAVYHGMMLSLGRVVAITLYITLHLTVFWRYRWWPIMAAHLIAITGCLLLWRASGAADVWAGIVLTGILSGFNYFASIVYSTSGFSDDRRGFASGMHEATLALGLTSGAIVGGVLAERLGTQAVFAATAGVLAGSAVLQSLVWLAMRPQAAIVVEA